MDRLDILHSLFKSAKRHPDVIREYMRNYMRNRYHSVRDRVMKELGGKCAHCGSKKDLQFDHIDSSKKEIRMADIHSVSDKALQKELKNVQILCQPCHNEKSKDVWDFSTPQAQHGTYWMYHKHGCRCKKCTKAYSKQRKTWRKADRVEELTKLAQNSFTYHRTQPENMADILNDGLQVTQPSDESGVLLRYPSSNSNTIINPNELEICVAGQWRPLQTESGLPTAPVQAPSEPSGL